LNKGFAIGTGVQMTMNQTSKSPVGYVIEKPDTVRTGLLDPIDYAYQGQRDIIITVQQPEFTSVCPMTGLPDFGTISIRYMPDRTIIELKSLKFYLLQYRNVGIFYEHLVNRILDDLVGALKPKWMEVQGKFTSRGGITSEVKAQFPPDRIKE
jgi:7-cyano-7-deazaguanine reductase